MMILTDGIHLASDKSDDELHVFARRIGLKRRWFQDKRMPHYDLSRRMWVKAEKCGAKRVTTRVLAVRLWVRICKENK